MGVRYDPGGGGAVPVTSYSETFNRVDQPPFLGDKWIMETSSPTALAGVTIAGLVNVGGGFASFGLGGSGGTVRAHFIPLPVDPNAVKTATVAGGRTQFSQLTVKNVGAGVTCAIGPMVYNPKPNDSNAYILMMQLVGQTLQLFRDSAIINAAVGTYVVGDVLRIECVPAVASNTILCYKNGVLQSTDVDNNALRPQGGGMFGINFFSSNAGGGQLSFGDWSGGLV